MTSEKCQLRSESIATRRTYFAGLIRQGVRSLRLEECVIGVEHLSGETREPFAGDSSSVDSLLVVESYAELSVLDFVSAATLKVVEGILESATEKSARAIELNGGGLTRKHDGR